jgi:hypothetical protein
MENPTIWLLKLVLSHLLTDFVFQPASWVSNRKRRHFKSIFLYLHGLITAAVALLFIGPLYWKIAIIIFVTHTLIDGVKSYTNQIAWFFIDQLFHLLVITACYYYLFLIPADIAAKLSDIIRNVGFWKISLAAVFLTVPSGIIIGLLTRKWREKIETSEEKQENLASAGKWIGIIERLIVFIFVLHSEYEAIGLLIAAKSLLRFNEKDRPEIKTEYLLIGTLLSIGIAIFTGICVSK